MSPNRPSVLVLTATITPPPDVHKLARADPKVRLRDYCEAMEFYLDLPSSFVDRIIFIENSDTDLDPIRAVVESSVHDKRVELIGFNGNDFPPSYSRAYGEFRLLDYGLGRCKLIESEDVLWKVTGRLRVLNLAKLIRTAPENYGIYCDLRNVPFIGNRLGGNQWMDLRLFSFTVRAYDQYLRGRYLELRHDLIGTPEFYFYQLMTQTEVSKSVIPRFVIQPTIVGYGACYNANYQDVSHRAKNVIRAWGRRLVPRLWI